MFTVNCKGRLLKIDKPIVMGILNITPDSFYKNSRIQQSDTLLERASAMLADGASILDIGGQSTRPGSDFLKEDEEMARVIPAIMQVHQQFPDAIISVDTFWSAVAAEAVNAGASIINDISAGSIDPEMKKTVARLNVPYILMHMKGNPQNMQQYPHYENLLTEIIDFFIYQTDKFRDAGVNDIIIDPGFGFGKTVEQNYLLLKNMDMLKILDCSLMAGISRKSMVTRTLETSAVNALNGTTVLNTLALIHGAKILRVHDVKEAIESIKIYNAYAAA